MCFLGSSDLMDRLVDEAEGLAMDSSSSVCSGAGGGGRMESTDQQLSLLNSITASDLTGQLRARLSIYGGNIDDLIHVICAPSSSLKLVQC